jgi:hypothetical protein
MLFMEMAETLDFMRFSGINNDINKLFTLALSGWFWEKSENNCCAIYTIHKKYFVQSVKFSKNAWLCCNNVVLYKRVR